MAPKRAHNNKGQHKPDPTAHKRIKAHQPQQAHDNVQRTSTRVAQTLVSSTQQTANQVFAINELLEQILLHVGTLKDLVRVRGVNRQWKAVIEGTKSLKQIIFLSPQKSDHVWHTFVNLGPDGPLYKFVMEPKENWEDKEYPGILQSARINPLLFRQLSKNAAIPLWYTGREDRWTSEELHLRKGASIDGTKIKVSSPLLNMFATQPPLEVMTFRTGSNSARQIRNRKGIKVIDVLRVAQGLVGGLDGRVVVDYVLFAQEDDDEIYPEYHLDRFYTWN